MELMEVEKVAEPRALAPVDTSPAALVRLAVERGADLAMIERMVALQTQMEERAAFKAYTKAMTGFKAEPMEIFKKKQVGYTTKEGEFVGYKHAELSDVTDVVVPAMARHQLSHRWNVTQAPGMITVDCIVTHVDGHSETVTMQAAPDTSGKKNAIQSIASAVSYLQRYTLLAATGMATKGADDDGANVGGAAERQDWLVNWMKQLDTAPNVGELKARYAQAVQEAKNENDQDAEDRFHHAYAEKMARAKRPTTAPAQASRPRAEPPEEPTGPAFTEDEIPH